MIIIKKYLYCVYIWNIFQYQTFIMIVLYILNNIFFILNKNMMCQDYNGRFNYRIKFIFNQKIYIKIMRCKIVKFQNLMWHNIMRSTKSQKSFGFTLQYRLDFFIYSSLSTFFLSKNVLFSSPLATTEPPLSHSISGISLTLQFLSPFSRLVASTTSGHLRPP